MSMPETHDFSFKGVPLRAYLDHVSATATVKRAGVAPPPIPAGMNTVRFPFVTDDGLHAVAVSQRGFAPRVTDDEHEVNGMSVVVLLDRSWNEKDAQSILTQFSEQLLTP